MNALELRAALALAAVYMFRMLGLFMVLPVLALTAPQFDDYSPFLVGLAIGGYGLMQAILQIPFGSLSDKWGRKPVIFLGLAIFVLGSVVAAQADSMTQLIIGRFLQGGGAIAAAILALATDISREQARPYVMATIGIAIGFSFYLAVLIGPTITAAFGLAGVFWLTASFALASVPLILLLVPNPQKSIASLDLVPQRSGIIKMFTASQMWRFNVNVFLLHLCITLLFIPLPKMLTDVGLSLNEHWQLYLPMLLIAIVGMSALMAVARKGYEKLAIILSAIFMMLGLLSLVLLPISYAVIIFAAILFFSGFNYLEAFIPTMVARVAPAGEKGSAMGLYTSFQFIGAFFGGLIAGTILTYTSAKVVLLVGAGLCLIMVWVSSYLRPMEKTSRIALSLSTTQALALEQLELLKQLDGVIEARFSINDNVAHLKITENFNQNAAKSKILEE